MIVEERSASFIRSLVSDEDAIITTIGQEALDNYVPIIRPEMRELLKVLFAQKKPMRVLEIGTAVGYSALCMSSWLPEGGSIVTIENYPPRIAQAKENISRANAESVITLLEGDAREILKTLDGPFDFVFMDAAKGQYIHFLEDAVKLLASGGIMITDNVLQDGEILESHFTVPKRNRTIHDRLREYLRTLKNNEQLTTTILPVGDGVAYSVKK